ncbi:amidase [Verrucosispora sp. NA02020]|uniref:amidase n=1 Tax=Verrucosispora sp. NA02020 TaxID=2742132 RepID=UPI0015902417|nr:amidase [Verrucosispora sp. NA02020]QKW13454.1 amidase [Verrucosispora sp. NA02020]
MTTTEELTWLDAHSQAALVHAGRLTPGDLVRAAVARIERMDPTVNAVIHRRFAAAVAEADALAGRSDLPFPGVPMLLKDLGCTMAGEPDQQGSVVLRDADHRATRDAHATRRLRAAGFVVLGRTAVPEFGLAGSTESAAHGATRNPWALDRVAGGSSGGAAAAVAAGMVPLAQGSDGGGSIRNPAAYCGLVGLKPSRGRVSSGPDTPDALVGHATFGVLTRSVRDTAALLDLLQGYEPGDPAVAPAPSSSYTEAITRPAAGLTIGLLDADRLPPEFVEPANRDAVRECGELLGQLGHTVRTSHPEALFDPDYHERFVDALSPAVSLLAELIPTMVGRPVDESEHGLISRFWIERGRALDATSHRRVMAWMDRYRERMLAWWREHDVLVTPVSPWPPPPLGWFDGPAGVRRSIEFLRFVPQFNSTGQPAVAVPLFERDGLPLGVQLVADYGREDLLLQLAAQLEDARPWAGRHPVGLAGTTARPGAGVRE